MSERLTDEQLREIEARYKASTEGVWYWGEGNSTVLCNAGIVTATKNIFVNCGRGAGEPTDEDRDFLANAHQDIPALLAEIRELSDELSACKESPGGCGYWREAARHREQERDEAREQAALEALKIVSEAVRMYWGLFKKGSDMETAFHNLVRTDAALNLEDQIIRHFQLPPRARIEVDDQERVVREIG